MHGRSILSLNNGDREVLLGAIDSREAETKVLPAAMAADTRMSRKILEPKWPRADIFQVVFSMFRVGIFSSFSVFSLVSGAFTLIFRRVQRFVHLATRGRPQQSYGFRIVFLMDSKGAKACKSCRSRYFLAKFGFDTNVDFDTNFEPLKVCQKLAKS